MSIKHCNETEFIFALYKKNEKQNFKFEYSYSKELKFIKKIYRNDNIRFFITRLLKKLYLYNFFLRVKNF